MNQSAGIEAIDPLHGRYAWILSESRDDFDARMGIEEHSARTRETLTEGLLVLSVQGPECCTISGFPALEFEIEAVFQMIQVKVLAHHDRRPPRVPSSDRVVDEVAVQPQGTGQGSRRFSRNAGA